MNNFEKKNEKLIVFVFFAKIIFRYCLNKESDDEIKPDLLTTLIIAIGQKGYTRVSSCALLFPALN